MKHLLVGTLLAYASTAYAAPIRVGAFKGSGPGRIWHTNTHTAGTQIGNILAAPDAAGLGQSLTINSAGFVYTLFGTPTGIASPTLEQKDIFLSALDTLDLVVFVSNTAIGDIFTDSADRARIESFWRRKGVVSVHATTDSYGRWPEWDSLHGARFQNHPSGDRNATIRLDTVSGQDVSWYFLNKGLADTTFLEEWFSFTTDAGVIRGTPGLKTTLNIDEQSYMDSLGRIGGARIMGSDHPMSWYREFPEGGKFFYTALGHRANLYQGGAQPRFLRRQLYNAILWAAGVDSTGTVVSVADRAPVARARFADHARVTFAAGVLTVSLLQDEPASVEVLGVDGRRLAFRRHAAGGETTFSNLTPGVRLVVVTSPAGRYSRLVHVP